MINNIEELEWLHANVDKDYPEPHVTHIGIDPDGEIRFWNRTCRQDFYPNVLPPKECRRDDYCYSYNMITIEEFKNASAVIENYYLLTTV